MSIASARKDGRNPRFPYVPIIDSGTQETGVPQTRTEQIRGYAYTTRKEAIACAERIIRARAADLERRLAEPRHRALREQHGLPRDI